MIFQSSSRSIKRQRLLKKILIISFITSFIFIIYLNKTELNSEVRPIDASLLSHNNNIHGKYHLQQQAHYQYEEKQHEVTVPREVLIESMRRARQERLSRYSQEEKIITPEKPNQEREDNRKVNIPTKEEENKKLEQQKTIHVQDITTSNTVLEDKVYKKESDNNYLPNGDGKDMEEKYLSYLPHSGFHNQRIAMVNALLLAHCLNRTLLLPPVKLGAPIHWRKHESLELYHRRLSKATLNHCQLYLIQNNDQSIPSECEKSFKYTSLRWDRLFSLEGIKQKVRIRYRDDYDRHYLEKKYGITKADTYYIKDELLYDYRIIENGLGGLHKYQRIIKVEDLVLRKERLISFGSLFGNGRMILQDKSLLTYLNQQLIFDKSALPDLFNEMERMLSIIGGPTSYISIHARTGDSIFERFAPQVMEKLWTNLQRYVPILQESKYLEQEQFEKEQQDSSYKCYESSNTLGPAIDWEQKKVINQRSLVMFMATDSMNPRENDLFKNIYERFPCIVTLNDLFDFKSSPLATMINPEDGINYGKFLIPFLDGLMASRGQTFNGSIWSTFSKYIEYLHENYLSN
ncbi:unnamed protein product [Cunninghamella blakesleeana]